MKSVLDSTLISMGEASEHVELSCDSVAGDSNLSQILSRVRAPAAIVQPTSYAPSADGNNLRTYAGTDYAFGANVFTSNFEVGDDCHENGLDFAVGGLYRTLLLTAEENEIVKLWNTTDGPLEEFFVLSGLHGDLTSKQIVILSEVSLGQLVGKTLSECFKIKGMSKNFFKIIEFTHYFDDLVNDKEFIRYWLERRQDLSITHPDAAELVTYMLQLV